MSEYLAEIQELIEKRRIEELLIRYCRALDRSDHEMLKSVYWNDAIDDHGIFAGNAHEFAAFVIGQLEDWFEVTTHSIYNISIDLQGDIAYTETYMRAYHRVRGERGQVERIFGSTYAAQFDWNKIEGRPHENDYYGRYIDKLEKRHGEWRILNRQVVTDYQRNGLTYEVAGEGIIKTFPPSGSRSRDDPSYRQD